MEISLWMPTFTVGNPDFRQFSSRAAAVEKAGFDGIYFLDHLLPISGVHTAAWLDPIVGMTAAVAVTERIRVGTASLIVGFRHPLLLAKQLASLAAVAGPRISIGASPGWFEAEYTAMGYRIEERRVRTDECLEALGLLLSADHVSHEGPYWPFEDVTISPRPPFKIPLLVGGGSRAPAAGSSFDRPRLAHSVLERILRSDGWLAPCAGNEALTYADFTLVRSALRARGRDIDAFRFAHVQWIHAVDTEDRERALREQLPRFRQMMGDHHSDQHLIDTYLLGSISDIRARVARLEALGFHELIVGPVVHDPSQIDMVAQVLRGFQTSAAII